MSSNRLSRLRNQAGASGNDNKGHPTQTSQPIPAEVNTVQVLQWHETRLKDLKKSFEVFQSKFDSLVENNNFQNNSNNGNSNDANQLLVVNDVIDRITTLSRRLDNVETLTKNLKEDYLKYKNGKIDNKVELVVKDNLSFVKNTENVVQETKAEVNEIKNALHKLNIEPTHSDVKPLDTSSPVGYDGVVSFSDLAGSAI